MWSGQSFDIISFFWTNWIAFQILLFELQANFSYGRTKTILISIIYSLNMNKDEKIAVYLVMVIKFGLQTKLKYGNGSADRSSAVVMGTVFLPYPHYNV